MVDVKTDKITFNARPNSSHSETLPQLRDMIGLVNELLASEEFDNGLNPTMIG